MRIAVCCVGMPVPICQGCLRSCVQAWMVAECGCADLRFPRLHPERVPFCTDRDPEQYKCQAAVREGARYIRLLLKRGTGFVDSVLFCLSHDAQTFSRQSMDACVVAGRLMCRFCRLRRRDDFSGENLGFWGCESENLGSPPPQKRNAGDAIEAPILSRRISADNWPNWLSLFSGPISLFPRNHAGPYTRLNYGGARPSFRRRGGPRPPNLKISPKS